MSRQYASQLRLEVGTSATYQAIIILVSGIVMLAIAVLDVNNFLINISLFLFALIVIVLEIKNNSPRVLQCKVDNTWTIEQGGRVLAGRLQEGSVVTSFFSVLHFKLDTRRSLHVVLFRDAVNHDMFRKLRVKLKVEGIKSSSHDKL